MKLHQAPPSIPTHDYSNAIESAVSWLGRRYLLAVPINHRARRPSGAVWYLESHRWLGARQERRG